MKSSMNLLKKICFIIIKSKYISVLIPSKLYLKIFFRLMMGKKLNLKNPVTFNEKLQWLKLYNKNPSYIDLVSKASAKEIVGRIIGEKYIIPTIALCNKFDEISVESLPNQFVIKTTHDSGGVVICKDKNTFDIKKAKTIINKSLKRNYYYEYREWPYKNVKKQIIIEPYLEDDSTKELRDYKFFCFNGYVDCVMVCIDRLINETKYYFFDSNWQLKRINKRGKEAPADFTLDKPALYDEMIKIAERLSKNIPFVRVDLYECNQKIYFGELTFYPQSGFDPNLLPETDLYFGKLININNI